MRSKTLGCLPLIGCGATGFGLAIQHVATVDKDFTVYRFKGRGRFVNVFADSPPPA